MLPCARRHPAPWHRTKATPHLLLLQATVTVCSMSEGGKYSYQYPRPSLTVDAVIVAAGGGSGGSAKLLLIQVRAQAPPAPPQGCPPSGATPADPDTSLILCQAQGFSE